MRFATKRPLVALWSKPNSFFTLSYKILNNKIDFLANNIPTELQTDKQYQ